MDGEPLTTDLGRDKVSVVVPARNEERTLERLLASLISQSCPPAEIVVVDGGSTDNTVSVASRFRSRGVRTLEIGPAYPGKGRNRGVAAAENDWLAFIDAGCEAHPTWLEELLRARDGTAPQPSAIFGNHEPLIRNAWDLAQALTVVPPPDTTGCRPWSIASALIHRPALLEAGGFPESLRAAEDLVFFRALSSLGAATATAPLARVTWTLADGPLQYFARLRLYSRHHAAAGLWDGWHLRVAVMDLLGAGLALGAARWPTLAVLLGAGVLLRTARSMHARRGNVPRGIAVDFSLALRVAALIGLADAAMWAGLADGVRGPGVRDGP